MNFAKTLKGLIGLGTLWLGLTGCTVPPEKTSLVKDFATSDGGSEGPDFSLADFALPAGGIGASCTLDAQCTAGMGTKSCWKNNILNDPGNLPTPGGYCTSSCTADADCAGQGTCQTIVTGKKFCLNSCVTANQCRVQDKYACFMLSKSTGYCYPSTRLTCNPTAVDGASGNGTCPGATPPSGCIRRAFENLGECLPLCQLGSGTCAATGGGLQHCVYFDATKDANDVATGDKFKGLACFPLLAASKQPGDVCSYFDECVDGYQCNLSPGGDKKCRQLCIVNASTGCDMGYTCKNVFNAGAGNPGLCLQ
jgi:hypothetical protein